MGLKLHQSFTTEPKSRSVCPPQGPLPDLCMNFVYEITVSGTGQNTGSGTGLRPGKVGGQLKCGAAKL